jgi:hypothetical protein
MTKIVGVGALMMVVAVSTGCLTRETVESIYMEADGTATWTVVERDTRSDERHDAGQLEETDYIAAAFLGQHPMARALETLRPLRIHTEILRSSRPYTVQTEASFRSFDDLMDTFASEIGVESNSAIDVRSTVVRQGTVVTWTISRRDRRENDTASDDGREMPIQALLDSFDHCRFVLTSGHFTNAVGFEISGDGRIATMQSHSASADSSTPASSADAPEVLSLTWDAAR